MSHVDEGALHAYLDGALDEYPAAEAEQIRTHLDACAECAARLEAEREVRTDAHAVLALATPNVALPSLEELRAYVKRTRPAPSRFSARVYRMGWAASVALALGTGWMLRDGQLATSSADAFRESLGAGASVSASTAAPLEAAPPAADADAAVRLGAADEGGQPAEAEAEPARRQAAPELAEAEASGVTASPEVTEPVVLPGAAAPAAFSASAVPQPAPTDVASADAVSPVGERAARSVPNSVAANTLADGAGALAGRPEPSEPDALVGTLGADRPAADEAAALKARAEADADRDEEERARSDAPVAVTSALDVASAASEEGVEEDAEREVLAGGAVPGLEVVGVSSIGEGTMYFGSRIVQRLEGGSLIEVYRLEYDVAPVVLGTPPDGQAEVSRKIEEEWVVIRGTQSPEVLEELILRLLPEG